MNYIRIKRDLIDRILGNQRYCYFDTPDHAADELFVNAGLKIEFGKEFAKDGVPLRVVFCSLPKKDAPAFESCLRRLDFRLVGMYGNPYRTLCDECFRAA